MVGFCARLQLETGERTSPKPLGPQEDFPSRRQNVKMPHLYIDTHTFNVGPLF